MGGIPIEEKARWTEEIANVGDGATKWKEMGLFELLRIGYCKLGYCMLLLQKHLMC